MIADREVLLASTKKLTIGFQIWSRNNFSEIMLATVRATEARNCLATINALKGRNNIQSI
jgi:hypothetical protein